MASLDTFYCVDLKGHPNLRFRRIVTDRRDYDIEMSKIIM